MPQITMIVAPNGETVTTVTGAKGTTCKKLTRDLEAILGGVILSQNTADFYETETVGIKTGVSGDG
jgi:hypothetical protein